MEADDDEDDDDHPIVLFVFGRILNSNSAAGHKYAYRKLDCPP